MNRWPQLWLMVRDVLTFGLGGYIAVHEVLTPPIDPAVLIFAGGLMGLPGVLRSNGEK